MTLKPEYKKYREVMLDEGGRFRTSGLFYEHTIKHIAERYPPVFTIKAKDRVIDGITYRSLKAIYFSYDHVPNFEYEFAMDIFGSWEHWNFITKKTLVAAEINSWKAEYTTMLKNEAHKTLIALSRDKEKGLSAARDIISDTYSGTKRGRPSKEEQVRLEKEEAAIRSTLASDLDRLGLSVVSGGKK